MEEITNIFLGKLFINAPNKTEAFVIHTILILMFFVVQLQFTGTSNKTCYLEYMK